MRKKLRINFFVKIYTFCLVAVVCIFLTGCSRKGLKLDPKTVQALLPEESSVSESSDDSDLESTPSPTIVFEQIPPLDLVLEATPSPSPAASVAITVITETIYPEGIFMVGDSALYSNGSHYCGFTSWEQFVNFTGRTDTTGIPRYATFPSNYDGQCLYPAGWFRVGAYVYYSNGTYYCLLKSFIYDYHYLPNYPAVPTSNIFAGYCS